MPAPAPKEEPPKPSSLLREVIERDLQRRIATVLLSLHEVAQAEAAWRA
jgi:hypothetical protein